MSKYKVRLRQRKKIQRLRFKDAVEYSIEHDPVFQFQLLEDFFKDLNIKDFNYQNNTGYRDLEIIRTTKKIAHPLPKDEVVCFTHIRCIVNNKGISTHSYKSFVDAKKEFKNLIYEEINPDI